MENDDQKDNLLLVYDGKKRKRSQIFFRYFLYNVYIFSVSDLPILGRSTIDEARSLLLWLKKLSNSPLGVAGKNIVFIFSLF